MNKVVTVNIGGMVFTIDEQAYEILTQYVETLKKHFANKQGADEILSDIESRIAEIIAERVVDKTLVVNESVIHHVIKLMGEPTDMFETQDPIADEKQHQQEPGKNEQNAQIRRSRSNKVLGGVCAGLGNYFNLDPIIFRGLFLVAFFVFGSGMLLYIILWVIIPIGDNSDVEQNNNARKLFRDGENSVLNGVCSGVAAYTGIDAVWFRLAFLIAFFFFGTGLFLYILLWAIIPKAKTTADRLKMRGEPIDVNTIEKKVRETFGGAKQQNRSESRNAANGFVKFFNGLTPVAQNAITLVLRIVGLALVLSILTAFVLFLVTYVVQYDEIKSFNDLFVKFTGNADVLSYLKWGFLLFTGGLLIQFFLFGIKLFLSWKTNLKWATILFSSITTVGLIAIILSAVVYINSVKSEEHEHVVWVNGVAPDTLYINTSKNWSLADSSIGDNKIRISLDDELTLFELYYTDEVFRIHSAEMSFAKSTDSTLKVELDKWARGKNETEAREQLTQLNPTFTFTNGTLTLDEAFELYNQPFKYQQLAYSVSIPVGRVVVMDYAASKMFARAMEDEDWAGCRYFIMTEKGLVPIDSSKREPEDADEDYIHINIGKDKNETGTGGNEEIHIEINGNQSENEEKIRVTSKEGVNIRTKKVGPIIITRSEKIQDDL